ncbi:MAG TPA: BPSS1780 family membrane protein [Burkholderiaceae bacterium]|jgi:hypothetical protein
MEKLSASVGWQWVMHGFALYRKQPAGITTLFLSYLFLMLASSIIPVAGQILPLILAPTFSMSFMQACLDIEQDKRVYPNLLLTGFRSPAFPALLKLGVLYFLCALIAMAVTSLFDEGFFWKLTTGEITLNGKTTDETRLYTSVLIWMTVFSVIKLPLWFTAPLLVWQRMSFGKAIFFSTVTVYRNIKSFLIYGLTLIMLDFFLSSIAVMLVSLAFGNSIAALLILAAFALSFIVVICCTFYPTYTYIFGKPENSSSSVIQ